MIVYSVNTMNAFLGVAPHDYLFPFVPTKTAVHIEGSSLFGAILGNKAAQTVLFDRWPAVQLGYDVGFFIPHYNVIPPFPPNLLLAKIIPFSSAKVIFGRASVLLEGTPAAINLPLLLCGEPIKVPAGLIVNSFRNTVIFSFDPDDVDRGMMAAFWDNARSRLIGEVAKKAGGEKLGKWLENKLRTCAGRFALALWLKFPSNTLPGRLFRNWLERRGILGDWLLKGIQLDGALNKVAKEFGKKAWSKLLDKIPMVQPEETTSTPAPAPPKARSGGTK